MAWRAKFHEAAFVRTGCVPVATMSVPTAFIVGFSLPRVAQTSKKPMPSPLGGDPSSDELNDDENKHDSNLYLYRITADRADTLGEIPGQP